MKAKIMTGLIMVTLAAGVNAGVAEKKAMRSADANIAEATAKTIAACGNAALSVNVSWDKFKTVATVNAAIVEKKNDKLEWIIGNAGERTVGVLGALEKICADADYKEEIALMTQIVVDAKENYEDYKSSFVLNGTVLNVSTGYYMSRNASDFVKKLKALY